MKVTLFIETSPDLFRSWLEDYTLGVPYRTFPTEKGCICLQKARPSRDHGYVGMEGIYCTHGDENSLEASLLSEVIRFKMVPLTTNRTEIVAECNQPAVGGYFLHLLNEVGRRWPQPADIEQRLVAIEQGLDAGFADLKRGQVVLYELLDQTTRESLQQIRELITLGRVERDEMTLVLDAIRRALQLMQAADTQVSENVRELLETAETDIEGELGLQQKLNLTLPIIPLFLNYGVELAVDSGLDMNAVVSELKACWTLLMAQVGESGEGQDVG